MLQLNFNFSTLLICKYWKDGLQILCTFKSSKRTSPRTIFTRSSCCSRPTKTFIWPNAVSTIATGWLTSGWKIVRIEVNKLAFNLEKLKTKLSYLWSNRHPSNQVSIYMYFWSRNHHLDMVYMRSRCNIWILCYHYSRM